MSKLLSFSVLLVGLMTTFLAGHAQTAGTEGKVNSTNCPEIEVKTKVTHTRPTKSEGQIELAISGGAMPYEVFWISGKPTEQNKATAKGLGKGFYSVVVVDKNRCSKTLMNIEVEEKSDK